MRARLPGGCGRRPTARFAARPRRSRDLPRVRAAAGRGGHQFLRALVRRAREPRPRRRAEPDLGRNARVPLQLVQLRLRPARRFARGDCRMVHRVDGPIGVYRGFDDGTDARIAAINAELADATVLQSVYSLEKHAELGIQLRAPVVITNAVDPAIFHPPDGRGPARRPAAARDRVELVAEPAEGRGRACLARPRTRPVARRPSPSWASRRTASSGSATSARSTPTASRGSCASTTSTWPRAGTTRARTRCSRRSRAGSLLRTSTAEGTPSSSAKAGCAVPVGRGAAGCARAASPPISTASARISAYPRFASVADCVPRRPRARRRGVALESLPVQNYLRRAVTSARFRLDRRLDRAAVSRAHDVLYESDAWTHATWLGTQALKNPLDLWVYQEIMDETQPELIVETGTYRGGSARLPRVALRSHGSRRGRVDRHRADARRLSRASADHVPRRALVDGSGGRRRGARSRCGPPDPRHPRLRPLAGARRGRARRVRVARASRLLRDRRGLEHRADPQGPDARPVEAVETFLATTDEFEIDREREKFLITFNPSGYLRRARAPA